MAFLDKLKPVIISGKEVLPIVEGGKGIGATCGQSSGAFAAAGAVGTFSGVNADLAVSDSDAWIYRLGYNITLLGRIVFIAPPVIF